VFLGSVAESVLRQAACPVLTLKMPAVASPLSPGKETNELGERERAAVTK